MCPKTCLPIQVKQSHSVPESSSQAFLQYEPSGNNFTSCNQLRSNGSDSIILSTAEMLSKLHVFSLTVKKKEIENDCFVSSE